MSRPVKKIMGAFLALAMVISLIPAVTLTAHATALHEDFDLLPPQESAQTDNPSISLDGFTYSTDSTDDALRIDTIAAVTGLLTSMGSGNALSSNWYGSNTGTYFQFKSTDPTDDFKLESFEAEVFTHSSKMSEIYTITGYHNYALVATATVNFAVSNIYGSDKSTISYTRQTIPGEEGTSNAGKLTFTGSDWSNIDQLRMTVADSAPNNILGVVIDNIDISAPVIPNTAPMANFGTAMDLGGSTYVTIAPAVSQNVTTQFTVEMWIKRTGGEDVAAYVFSRNGGENTGQWAVVSGNGGLRFYVGALDVGMYTGDNSKIPINDMLWHHAAYTYNGSVLTFYLDGAQIGQYESTISLPTDSTSFCIGNAVSRKNPTFDALDELRLWNTCRTREQIESDMYRSISIADDEYSSLVFYCKFEEGSGQSVTESITGNMGSVFRNLNGAPTDGSWVSSSDINPSWTTDEDTPFSGYLIGSDNDGDALTYSIETNGTMGTALIEAETNEFTYTPDPNANGADTFTYTVSDASSVSSPQTVSVNITPVNDAPVITAPASINVVEDIRLPLKGITISDVDAGSNELTATFSVPFGVLGTGVATTLMFTGTCEEINTFIAEGNLLYTSPLDEDGSLTLTITVTDNGYTGGGVEKTATTAVQLNITSVNDAPTMDGGPYVWAGTNEDTTSSSVTVSEILSALSAQDVDGDQLGIALTAAAGQGIWQYSTNGLTWWGVGMLSANAALLLSPDTHLRYVPDGQNGETAAISFRAWDQTHGSPSENSIRCTADATTNGGTTAYSTGIAQAVLAVSSVNDAPVLIPWMPPLLPGLAASQTENLGHFVSSFTFSAISDVDAVAAKGIAIVATADGGGKWQYSTNGFAWVDIGAVSQTEALLLQDTNHVRFVPGGPDAAVASITYRAWDGTSGTPGNKADVTTNGGTTAFSAVTDTASITVTPDASIFEVTSTAENGAYKAGDTIIITVRFNKTVTVTGTPQLTLKLGATNRVINYFSGSGTYTLSFTYTVQAGDACDDLDYANTLALSLNGGAIQAGGADASLILSPPGTARSLGANKAIEIDGIAPTITSVAVPDLGTYKTGDTLSFMVNFSEDMSVITTDGTPYLELVIGSETRHADYVSGSGNRLNFFYVVQAGDLDDNGISVNELSLNGGIISDLAGNPAVPALNDVGSTNDVRVDAIAPTVIVIARQAPSSEQTNTSAVTFRVTFSESVNNVSTDDFELVAEGTADGTIASVSAYSGSVIDVSVNSVLGDGALRLDLKSGTNIVDDAGNAAAGAYPGDEAYVIDKTAPLSGGAGILTTTGLTSNSVKLKWTAATDNMTAANLQYMVVYSSVNNIRTVSEAEANGTSFGDWSSNLTSAAVTGLTAGTEYYFNVIVRDKAENKAAYSSISAATAAASSSGVDDATTGSAVVEVNGEKQAAGTIHTRITGGQTVTTITVDDTKLSKILESKSPNATVTLPMSGNVDVTVGELSGQTIKNMAEQFAMLVIRTETATYTLPASEINMDDVSSQLGSQFNPKDIKVSVKIAKPSTDIAKIVEDTAKKNGYQIVVEPVEFEITCTSGGKTVKVSKFSSFVERTVAIPDGMDPSKITTGVLLNADGSFSHVPTQVIKLERKYYAKINSLTNSTYAVIWNPVSFSDMENHWAKDTVNNMGSRMVVAGIGNNQYAPNRIMTRAELAAVMVRALGLEPGTGASGFSDVASTDWCSGYIKSAAANGIIEGYGNGSFGPSDTITREQAMTMLARAMEIIDLDAGLTEHETGKLLGTYADGSAISAYARSSVAACIKTSITSGTSTGALSPKAAITRAEVAVMTERLLQKSGLILGAQSLLS